MALPAIRASFPRGPVGGLRSMLLCPAVQPAAPGDRALLTMLGNERADIVAGHTVRHGIPVVRSVGLGDACPLATAGSINARARNERVEVWLR